jgi:hypothetical protein
MPPTSPLRRACAQLAYLAETLSDSYPEEPAKRRSWLAEMRKRLAEVEAAYPEASVAVVDPTGTMEQVQRMQEVKPTRGAEDVLDRLDRGDA